MKLRIFSAATLFVATMVVTAAIAQAQAPAKVVASPTPSGQIVSPDQAHQDNKSPPLSKLRQEKSAEMGSGPQSAVRTPTPNGQMIHKDGSSDKPQN
jgi:hypothetical protein